jgi:hypothetical protein
MERLQLIETHFLLNEFKIKKEDMMEIGDRTELKHVSNVSIGFNGNDVMVIVMFKGKEYSFTPEEVHNTHTGQRFFKRVQLNEVELRPVETSDYEKFTCYGRWSNNLMRCINVSSLDFLI